MAGLAVHGSEIRGIASAVPATKATVDDLAVVFGRAEAEKIATSTGVRVRRMARTGHYCSDLCHAAAESLWEGLSWERDWVDGLVYISQSFDYTVAATSCVMQSRLGLSKSCAAFDVGLGWSGYVYGLWIASSLVSTGCRRVLLLAGDTVSRWVAPNDRSTLPLFGDAGSARALERSDGQLLHFELGTDRSGHPHIMVPVGDASSRVPWAVRASDSVTGLDTPAEALRMNGHEVFSFTIREVPSMITRALQRTGWDKAGVDQF